MTARDNRLRDHLERLLESTDSSARLAADPLGFVHRYDNPGDREVAAVVAASLAFGRVAAFSPVIDQVLQRAQPQGPHAWAVGFSPAQAKALAPLRYRWNTGVDFALLVATTGAAIRANGSLGKLFELAFAREDNPKLALSAAIRGLRALAVEQAPILGLQAKTFADLPRSFRTFLPDPATGSACKRWNLLLRWMCRPDDGVDLGQWAIPTHKLVVPLDTHVLKLARFTGLTKRKDGSWTTATEITKGLARLDPTDPVRYDFALAHVGISGLCRAKRIKEICGPCPLLQVCYIGQGRRVSSRAP